MAHSCRTAISFGILVTGLVFLSPTTWIPRAWSDDAAIPDGAAIPDDVATPVEPAPGISDDEAEPTTDDPSATPLTLPPDPKQRLEWLRNQLDAAITSRSTLATAAIGAIVVDATTGTTLWSHRSDEPRNLASVTKVLTATAALHHLGADFKWRTSLFADKIAKDRRTIVGNLYLRGHGDPTLTLRDLSELARDLRWRGIDTVTGDLVVDGSYFDDDDEPPRFDDQPKERAGYRAPIAAVSLERNAVTVVVVADQVRRGMASVRLDPPASDYVRLVEREVATVTTGRTRISVTSAVKPTHLELRVSGQILVEDRVFYQRRRIDEPERMVADQFRAALASAGIRVRGKRTLRVATPIAAVLLAEHSSQPLGLVMYDMNKTSNNFVAETVLKTLGAEMLAPPPPDARQRPGTWADGLAVVSSYLTETGTPAGSFRIENGSGLYDSTAISAAAVARVLVAAYRDFRVGPTLVASLPQAGVDGTLRTRLTDPTTRGRIRAKTGTLAATTTLAGYAGTESARPLVFVVLINQLSPAARPVARSLQDAVASAALAYTAQ